MQFNIFTTRIWQKCQYCSLALIIPSDLSHRNWRFPHFSGLTLEKFIHSQRTTAVLHHFSVLRIFYHRVTAPQRYSITSYLHAPRLAPPWSPAPARQPERLHCGSRLHRNSTTTDQFLRTSGSIATDFLSELSERVPYISVSTISIITLRPLPAFLQRLSSLQVFRAAELSTLALSRPLARAGYGRWLARQFRHGWL